MNKLMWMISTLMARLGIIFVGFYHAIPILSEHVKPKILAYVVIGIVIFFFVFSPSFVERLKKGWQEIRRKNCGQ